MFLGFILLYFIGKAFHSLAFEYDKNKWGFAILGVVSYYAGSFIGAILILLGFEIVGNSLLDSDNDLFLNLLALPFGAGACYGLHKFLQNKWAKEQLIHEDIIYEIGNKELQEENSSDFNDS